MNKDSYEYPVKVQKSDLNKAVSCTSTVYSIRHGKFCGFAVALL